MTLENEYEVNTIKIIVLEPLLTQWEKDIKLDEFITEVKKDAAKEQHTVDMTEEAQAIAERYHHPY